MKTQQWKVLFDTHDLKKNKHLKRLHEAQTARAAAMKELDESIKRVDFAFNALAKKIAEVDQFEEKNSSATELSAMRKHLFSMRDAYSQADQQRIVALKKVEAAAAHVSSISVEYQIIVERNKVVLNKYQKWLTREKVLEQSTLDEENHELFSVQRSGKACT
jgi:hypothetical protein